MSGATCTGAADHALSPGSPGSVVADTATLTGVTQGDGNPANDTAGASTGVANPSPSLSGGAGSDNWRVVRSGGDAQVWLNGVPYRSYPLACTNSLTFNGQAGDDTPVVLAPPFPEPAAPAGVLVGGRGRPQVFVRPLHQPLSAFRRYASICSGMAVLSG